MEIRHGEGWPMQEPTVSRLARVERMVADLHATWCCYGEGHGSTEANLVCIQKHLDGTMSRGKPVESPDENSTEWPPPP